MVYPIPSPLVCVAGGFFRPSKRTSKRAGKRARKRLGCGGDWGDEVSYFLKKFNIPSLIFSSFSRTW